MMSAVVEQVRWFHKHWYDMTCTAGLGLASEVLSWRSGADLFVLTLGNSDWRAVLRYMRAEADSNVQ